jgi:aspartate 1-decarboxylase
VEDCIDVTSDANGEKINTYVLLAENSEGMRPFGIPGVDTRITLR